MKKYIVTCRCMRDAQIQSYSVFVSELTDLFMKRYNEEPSADNIAQLEEFINDLEYNDYFQDREDELWYDADGEYVMGAAYANSKHEAIEKFTDNPFDFILFDAYRLYDGSEGE